METGEQPVEQMMELEGPAVFLDAVYEAVDAHITRTREEYGEIITGVDAVDAGDVDGGEMAVLHLYVPGDIDPDEAREHVDVALDRIAGENDMELVRYNVDVRFADEE